MLLLLSSAQSEIDFLKLTHGRSILRVSDQTTANRQAVGRRRCVAQKSSFLSERQYRSHGYQSSHRFSLRSRLGHHTDELGLIVQCHLLIEYVLNEINRYQFHRSTVILNDHRRCPFAIKARNSVFERLAATVHFQNIQRVNSIRKHLAHDLCWDLLNLDYRFSRDEVECPALFSPATFFQGRKLLARQTKNPLQATALGALKLLL